MAMPIDLIKIEPNNVVIFEWCFVSFSSLFVVLRLLVRLRQRQRINASDAMIVFALLCFIATASCDTVMVRSGFSHKTLSLTDRTGPTSAFVLLPADLLQHLMKMLYASTVPYYLSLWLVKITLVLLYYSLAPECMPGYRYALHVISAVVGVSLVLALCLNMFWCIPISDNWDLKNENACVAYFAMPPYLWTIVMHVLTEIMIFTYPLTLLRVLRFDRRSFRQAALMFAVGFVGMLISLSRIVYIHLVTSTSVIGVWQAWASVEQSVGIVVCCLPALRHVVVGAKSPDVHNERLSFIQCSGAGVMKKRGQQNGQEGETLDGAILKEIAIEQAVHISDVAQVDSLSGHRYDKDARSFLDVDIETGYLSDGLEAEPVRLRNVV